MSIPNPYSDCYCSCKLNANTLKWTCKMFESVKDAENYGLHEKYKATKLLVLPCFYKKIEYEQILKRTVEPGLYFGEVIFINL
uniref:Uncharacterized protein n=1 Tax=viral metagenome TaxID=1070528 RepID=A0A6C0KFS1_9ZZZZ